MSNKLDDLIIKFEKEDNVTGERIAGALKDYLSDFTDTLKSAVELELKSPSRVVNKINNMMIYCSNEGDYTARHMYPIIKDKEFNVLLSEKNDKTVLERLNAGIRECQSGKEVNFGSFMYRVPVCFIYVEATKEELGDLYQNKKFTLIAIDKDGQEHELPYYMIWSDLAISRCKKMWKMSQLYKDETPIVFAPYAKRLFRIDIDVEELTSIKGIQIKSIDFKLKENKLDTYFLINQELVWNAKIEEQSEVTNNVSPVADNKLWKYTVKDLLANQYIIPKENVWPTFRVESSSEKDICFVFENEYHSSFERVSIYEIDEKDFKDECIFRPNYNLSKYDKQFRVRSLADAYYEIKKFYLPNSIKFMNVQANKPDGKSICERYPLNMTVYDKGRFGYKNTNKLYVVFECNEASGIVFDYIDFILGYLTFCFPEIGWEGVI